MSNEFAIRAVRSKLVNSELDYEIKISSSFVHSTELTYLTVGVCSNYGSTTLDFYSARDNTNTFKIRKSRSNNNPYYWICVPENIVHKSGFRMPLFMMDKWINLVNDEHLSVQEESFHIFIFTDTFKKG